MSIEAPIPEAALAAIKAPFLAAGAQPIEPAVLQPLGLLLDLTGEALRERLFVVQGEGGEERCLRPDFTIPAVRAHIASGRSTGRYVYDGSVFLVSGDGSDEPEEVRQIGIEAFEARIAAEADAEIAALAWRACTAGRRDLLVRFGDAGLFAAFIDTLALAEPLAARLKRAFGQPRRLRAELDAAGQAAEAPAERRLENLLVTLPEGEAAQVLEELWSLAAIQPVGGRPAAEIVHRLSERAKAARAPALTLDQAALIDRFLRISAAPAQALEAVHRLAPKSGRTLDAALKGWDARLVALADEGVPAGTMGMTLATAFSRPFGYYDGVFFEIVSAALGDDAPLAAGGRYDGLPARLGSPRATGAVGCMVRPGRAWAGAAA